MATFSMQGSYLDLEFSRLERVGGLRRGARVPLDQVATVYVSEDPWSILSGMRVGTGIPYVAVIGTMVRSGPNDVVCVRGRKPAVVVELREGAQYQRLIATVEDPEEVAATIERALR